MALKSEYNGLVQDGTFRGEVKKEISRQMGILLRYSKENVEKEILKTK